MSTSISALTPYIPSDNALGKSSLPDQAVELNKLSAGLMGQISPITLATLSQYMSVINSYYSNLIEGNATRPHEIRAAQREEYSDDPIKRDLQKESLAHISVQQWLREKSPDLDTIYSTAFIKELHMRFYQQIPESLWLIKNEKGDVVDKVVPGEWRTCKVDVGRHIAPDHDDVNDLMEGFCDIYHSKKYQGDRKLIAVMAAHHRFTWIHPFIDGNGRVGRLLTDAVLKAVGLDSYGAWCLSRGLAKSSVNYKALLATADAPRQGDLDGRGVLTEKGLLGFCDYMLATAIDQVSYISHLLDLSLLRKRIDAYIQARNDFRVLNMTESLKTNAALVLHTAFIQGELERAQAVELCAMPERSARRLLSQLKKDGLLSETSSKSPLRWEIPEHAEAFYFPQLTPEL
ncbi:Fic family protein [Cocleimonas sp. KMM 6892]|uniref:Fic family protein n=1 Tax=unclassified Cocleimonas TaxID=2639732 RepID=UPI002DB8DB9D|nr:MULTISPECIES: Fic family protein [unclassified Cocleimonas]MEB8432972.1 Fic family protein [Cocleimonas sp. KMM 6892]MEC4716047.1 Fic family protein [Cocleimonas sp. KMM 6895]MEC4745508.1 Fic family protein [Cocleimonas sp. KMM 6896]